MPTSASRATVQAPIASRPHPEGPQFATRFRAALPFAALPSCLWRRHRQTSLAVPVSPVFHLRKSRPCIECPRRTLEHALGKDRLRNINARVKTNARPVVEIDSETQPDRSAPSSTHTALITRACRECFAFAADDALEADRRVVSVSSTARKTYVEVDETVTLALSA